MAHTIESMSDNLFWKLRLRILKTTENRIMTVSEIADLAYKYAPKAIKSNQKAFGDIIRRLWSIDNDYGIESCSYVLDDFNDCMELYFGNN